MTILRTRVYEIGQDSAGFNFCFVKFVIPADYAGTTLTLELDIALSGTAAPDLSVGGGNAIEAYFTSKDDMGWEQVTPAQGVDGVTKVYYYEPPVVVSGGAETGYDITDASLQTYTFVCPHAIDMVTVPFGGGLQGASPSYAVGSHNWTAGQHITIFLHASTRPVGGDPGTLFLDIHAIRVNGINVEFGSAPGLDGQSVSAFRFNPAFEFNPMAPVYEPCNPAPITGSGYAVETMYLVLDADGGGGTGRRRNNQNLMYTLERPWP